MTKPSPAAQRLIKDVEALPVGDRVQVVRALIEKHGLFGAFEAAEKLHITQTNLRPIPGLPEPVATAKCGSLWLGTEVKEFAKVYRRKWPRGRPRGKPVSSNSR